MTGRTGCRRYRRDAASLDCQFDRLIPNELRHLSSSHWTPVQVAVRAASLLCSTHCTRVLDVGSGVGKLCTIGALSAFGIWVGVEQHAALVKAATELARILGVSERTRFVEADVFSIDWNQYDALYLYNPFDVPGPMPLQAVQVAQVQRRLAALPGGTRVVTFNGFGGAMPPTFELLYHEQVRGVGLDLTLWIQRGRRAPSAAS
jgi:SAM-dependent methyltransferase